jgi:hypothetical protein
MVLYFLVPVSQFMVISEADSSESETSSRASCGRALRRNERRCRSL